MKRILLILSVFITVSQADFSRDADGIVTDNITGLQWQDNGSGGTRNWRGAIDYCESLVLGSFSDWRLPNINELFSIVENTHHNPAMDPVFEMLTGGYYWSSTSSAVLPSSALSIYFDDGAMWSVDKVSGDVLSHYGYTRCVRGGK
ncbi:DUF1566 domain-containing protein [Sulfurimonas sp. HSL-1656]|uniref:Lcl C-terminal domain-containing protein n=1 Tax=Thiomicrolovo subterrani TaxID=3131934 RepID=UPI0031F9F477